MDRDDNYFPSKIESNEVIKFNILVKFHRKPHQKIKHTQSKELECETHVTPVVKVINHSDAEAKIKPFYLRAWLLFSIFVTICQWDLLLSICSTH